MPFPKLNPDHSAHLILSPVKQPYHYQMISNKGNRATIDFNGAGSHFLFPQTSTIEMDHNHAFIHLGIKFHTGALYSLPFDKQTTPQNVQLILDSVSPISLSTLLNNSRISEDEILIAAKTSPVSIVTILDALLLPWISKNTEDKHSELTRKILPLLYTHSVTNLSELLACSQRTLERSFNRVTGLTMKQCQSVNKLEMMLQHLHHQTGSSIDWADIAYQFGFSDQPHLARHLKHQLGLTPKNYIATRNFTIDVYGGVTFPNTSDTN